MLKYYSYYLSLYLQTCPCSAWLTSQTRRAAPPPGIMAPAWPPVSVLGQGGQHWDPVLRALVLAAIVSITQTREHVYNL